MRCFEDDNVIHVEGRVDPVARHRTIDTELCLKDLETVEKRLDRAKKDAEGGRQGREEAKADLAVCEQAEGGLDAGKPARAQGLNAEERRAACASSFLLTAKPVLYVANVAREAARPAPTPTRSSARCARTPKPRARRWS